MQNFWIIANNGTCLFERISRSSTVKPDAQLLSGLYNANISSFSTTFNDKPQIMQIIGDKYIVYCLITKYCMFAGQGEKTKQNEKEIPEFLGKISLDFIEIYSEFLSLKDNPVRTRIFEMYEHELDKLFPRSKYINRIVKKTMKKLFKTTKLMMKGAFNYVKS